MQVFYNFEIEKYIIGCLIIDKQDEIHTISEFDFYSENYKTLFKIMKWMGETNKEIDYLALTHWADKKINNSIEIITECVNCANTTTLFNTHFVNLKALSTKRQMQRKLQEAINLLNETQKELSEDIKNDILEKISEVQTPTNDNAYMNLCNILQNTTKKLEEESKAQNDLKLFTGFKKLDNITAGLHEQELTIIAARPGVGKTALALNLLINLAKRGNNCLFISREMSSNQISKRLVSIVTGIDSNKMRIPKALKYEDWNIINNASTLINKMQGKIYIDDTTYHVQGIRSQVRSLYNKKQCDILFVDYLGLVKTLKRCESHRIEIEDVSWNLKHISKEFNIPVIVLCQLNRMAEHSNEEPQLHHLRESGAIEQDADNVLMIYQPDETDNPFLNIEPDKTLIQVLVRKQRNGPTGTISLLNTKNNFKYYNID